MRPKYSGRQRGTYQQVLVTRSKSELARFPMGDGTCLFLRPGYWPEIETPQTR
ncbi:hypothetical protein PISMIDRAFT_672217 [Pisolithus microcarpus 441]|uniref:Uncharacterized protein n=1 Tax=Pisolithus microcarpus 441 TaxID=765257 RepID=A0A0C9ZUB1_9AGAM|nr:hypothetical protein PISMIDRAFT_672217 [Pisolithus microcarpus 441]